MLELALPWLSQVPLLENLIAKCGTYGYQGWSVTYMHYGLIVKLIFLQHSRQLQRRSVNCHHFSLAAYLRNSTLTTPGLLQSSYSFLLSSCSNSTVVWSYYLFYPLCSLYPRVWKSLYQCYQLWSMSCVVYMDTVLNACITVSTGIYKTFFS